MEVVEAIKGRRSIRRYKATPVSDEQLDTVLEAARWAPSWVNSQCWSFVVVRDVEIKERLIAIIKPGNRAIPAVKQAPVLIVACAQKGKAGYHQGAMATDKGDWFMFDVALATQNMALAAHALGLGTLHVGLFDAPKAAEIIGTPEDVVVVAMMPLGYPDEQPIAPEKKKLEEFVFLEKHGRRGS